MQNTINTVKKRLAILILLISFFTSAFSQELSLHVSNRPLNVVLNMLDVEISFDDKALSQYKVSVSETFKTPEEAIRFLLKDKPFKMEKVEGVFVIYPAAIEENKKKAAPKKRQSVHGAVSDKSTGEPLPYAHIQTKNGVLTTNESGFFSIEADNSDFIEMEIQHLGFQVLDTTLKAGAHQLLLTPKIIGLEEVVVSPPPASMVMQMGKTSGETRINHQVARYMPGSADNSVFNLLRMMPGVRASGEPSEGLLVWGSNWGESRLVFDGFTIFGMKSFNDQIGSVNPYLAKDIRLSKAGFGASQGNRIGAVAEVTGNNGDFNKASAKANVSNYAANIYASVPIKNTSALSFAYRQTFYNLYGSKSIDGQNENGHGRQETSDEIYIEPEYDFRDFNIKYTGKAFRNDSYHISLYGAHDQFHFGVKQNDYEVNATEKSRQYGAAANYNRVWNDGSYSKLLVSHSKLSSAVDNVLGIKTNRSSPLDVFHIKNEVGEWSFKMEHHFNIGKRQHVQIGGAWQHYATSDNIGKTDISVPSLHLTDEVLLGKLSLKAGLRGDFAGGKAYIQPRFSARYAISDRLTATASLGRYNQFLSRQPYLYRSGSYQLMWQVSDSAALESTHLLAGLAYSQNGWLIGTEAYLRKNRNQVYYLDNELYKQDNDNIGFDVFVKKQWGEHTLFGSYSLVSSTAPQKSTGRETKLGAICSLTPFFASVTYVYGRGFPYLSTGGHGHGQGNGQQQHGSGHQHSDVSSESYSRFDLSVFYKLPFKKFDMQAGASLLNTFNTNNVKYSYRLSDPDNVFNIYTKATPLSPVVFVEIVF